MSFSHISPCAIHHGVSVKLLPLRNPNEVAVETRNISSVRCLSSQLLAIVDALLLYSICKRVLIRCTQLVILYCIILNIVVITILNSIRHV